MTHSFGVFNEALEPLAINQSPHPYFPTGDFRPTTMLLYCEVWRTMALVLRAVATLLNFATIRRPWYPKEFWPVLPFLFLPKLEHNPFFSKSPESFKEFPNRIFNDNYCYNGRLLRKKH